MDRCGGAGFIVERLPGGGALGQGEAGGRGAGERCGQEGGKVSAELVGWGRAWHLHLASWPGLGLDAWMPGCLLRLNSPDNTLLEETRRGAPLKTDPYRAYTPPLGKIQPFATHPLYISVTFEPMMLFQNPFGLMMYFYILSKF